MDEGNPQKYIIYAVGEILLVVVGILIALQINNWNEDRKTRRLENEYLHALEEEFNYNLESLEKLMKVNERNINSARELSKHTSPDPPQIKEKELALWIFDIANYEIHFRPRSAVLEEIISSGKLGVFSSANLRSSLSSWNGIMLKVRYQEEELAKWRFQILDFAKIHGNARRALFDAKGGAFGLPATKFERKNTVILQSVEFENLLLYYLSASTFINQNYYSDLKIELLEILKAINNEFD